MGQFITKCIITLLFLFLTGTFGFFLLRRTWKSEIDLSGWFRRPVEKLIPIKEQAVPTDATGVLRTDKAPLFEDEVNVYLGSNLARQAVERVGKRQVVRALKGLDIALEAGQIKVTAKVLSSDGKVAVQITDNEWEINPNAVFRKNFDKHGLEVIDNYGRSVLQVDLLDKQTLKVAGFFELEGTPICITDIEYLKVTRSNVDEHLAKIAGMLKRQGLMFRYPADKHFGERADRPQIKLRGRDERLSTKNLAAKRKKLSALSNVDLKKRVHELVAAIQQSISHALKDIETEHGNIYEEFRELDEILEALRNTEDPNEKRKLIDKMEQSKINRRLKAPLQEYEDQFKPDIVASYDEIAFRLGTRAKEMPRRVLFEIPTSAHFLNEALNKLASVMETLE